MNAHPLCRPALLRPVLAWIWLLLAPLAVLAQTTVRVVDYNIHRDIGTNNPNTAAQGPLAEVINHLEPDIWTINELGGNSAGFSASTARVALSNFIREELTIFGPNPQEGVNFFLYVGTFTDGFTGNAIVSRYPFLSTQSFSDAGGGFAALRGLALAVVDLPGVTDLGVFTAHLKAFNDTNSAERRQAQAKADRDHIASWIAAHGSFGAVLTGDFNESEDPDDATNWSGHRIGDVLPSGQVYQPITTLKSAGFADPKPLSIRGNKDTIDATSPDARFDYTLYTPGLMSFVGGEVFDTKQYTAAQLAALNQANGASFVAGDSAAASDHLPVLAVFSVIPEPATGAMLLCGVAVLALRKPRRV